MLAAPFYAPNLGSALFTETVYPPVRPFGRGGSVMSDGADLDFAKRFNLARLGIQTQNLADVLTNPASQLDEVLRAYNSINSDMTKKYKEYVTKLRGLALPEEEVALRADAYIRPILNTEMELLRLKFPYSVGNAAGGSLNPIQSLANGTGEINEAQASGQFRNYRSLKKAFKERKARRKAKRARKAGKE